MQYACLVYHEEKKLDAVPEAELAAMVSACRAWLDELKRGGHHVFSAGLQSFRTATTMRHRNGKLSVTDGPFAETKEFLGGFTILEARDLNEAIRLASKLPAARLGSVEVRPVLAPDVEFTDRIDRKIGVAMRQKQRAEPQPAVSARL
jgi:hypothetical protein